MSNFHISFDNGVVSSMDATTLKKAKREAEYRCSQLKRAANILDRDSLTVLANVHYTGQMSTHLGIPAYLAVEPA
jgi:hypothetical protein